MLNNKVVPICRWQRIRNNGDAITSMIVDEVLGGCPVQGIESSPHLLATGSIFFMANPLSLIWGSGVLNREAYLPDLTPRQIRAVRGRLSADFLVEKGIHLGDVPFGDPGILVNKLTSIKTSNQGSGRRIAVVPHHDDIDHPFYRTAADRDDVLIVNILDDTLKPIQEIADAEIVISQSLHGLIYAESFGKPSIWISHRSDDIWSFKFLDWFTTVYNPQEKPLSMDLSIDEMVRQAERRYSSIDVTRLLGAFPTEISSDVARPKFDYKQCRSQNPVQIRMAPKQSMSLTENQTEFLADRFKDILHTVYEGWAETTYSVVSVGETKLILTPDQVLTIVAEMDKRAYADYALIIKNSEVDQLHVTPIWLLSDLCIYEDLKNVSSQTFVLRPKIEQLGQNYLVFGI